MKKVGLLIMILSCVFFTNKIKAQTNEETNEKVTTVKDRVDGIDERLTTAESDLAKLKKIKFSGYILSQFENYADKSVQPNSFFSVREARFKLQYEAADGVNFVLQPDFSPGLSIKKEGAINSYIPNLSIKDAYVQLNDRWLNTFSLWAGKFNRPNYEVEQSSAVREVPERSRVIKAIYPGERGMGFKIEANPQKFPLHVQLAILNGNEGFTMKDSVGNNLTYNENTDFDNFKDIMARATYNLKVNSMLGIDFGGTYYMGKVASKSKTTLNSDYTTTSTVNLGDAINRNWWGVEMQVYLDVLGGMSLKGEYMAGKNATMGNIGASGVFQVANFQNNFSGYYAYLIKNIGKKNQFAFRLDYYDPNTDISGSDIGVKKFAGVAGKVASRTSGVSDIAYTTYNFAWHYYFNDNVRISLMYSIVQNEKVGVNPATNAGYVKTTYTNYDGTTGTNDYSSVFNQNILTLRLTTKF